MSTCSSRMSESSRSSGPENARQLDDERSSRRATSIRRVAAVVDGVDHAQPLAERRQRVRIGPAASSSRRMTAPASASTSSRRRRSDISTSRITIPYRPTCWYRTAHDGGSRYFMTCDPSSGGIGIRLNAIRIRFSCDAEHHHRLEDAERRARAPATHAPEQARRARTTSTARDARCSRFANTPASETMMSPRLKFR